MNNLRRKPKLKHPKLTMTMTIEKENKELITKIPLLKNNPPKSLPYFLLLLMMANLVLMMLLTMMVMVMMNMKKN